MKKYILGFGLFVFSLLLTSNAAFAVDTSTLYTVSNGSYTDWANGESTVDETGIPVCSLGDSIISLSNGERESFNIDLSSIPDNSTITSVNINVSDRGNILLAGGKYKTFIKLNGTNTDAGVELSATGSGAGSTCTTKIQNIPVANVLKTGATTLEIGVLKTDFNGVRVGAINATVTYSLPVKVTIVKYINGAVATAVNTNSASFPMTASWDATNIGAGTGNYNLSTVGYNNPNPYYATTSDMSFGADYSTYENTGTSCILPMMYALVGYTVGNTLEEASLAIPTTTVPNFTDLSTDKFVIVWNKTCVDLPTHLTPADNSIRTTAEQTLIDWSDVTNWASPITYMYQSALSMLTNIDGSFASPAYTSGTLTSSEIPTPGTPEGIYYWHVKATDAANNTSGWTNPWKITINNTGTLTINKNVLKPNGETEVSDNQSFSVMLNGSNTQSVSENTSYTYTALAPGMYTVTEGENGNYTFVSFSNDSDTETAGAQVEVVANQNTIVTITNKQKQATLTVNKVVTNPNGGEAVAADFSFQVNGGDTVNFLDSEDENLLTGQNIISVDPGVYTISEVLPEGSYAISYSENCTSVVLLSNGSANCTITNSDIPAGKGAITVRKIVNNMYAGTLTVNDFDLFINDGETNTEVASSQSIFLDPGTYTISEGALPSGYMQSSLVCSSNGDEFTNGVINLTEQDSWVCTITNNDKPAKLTIVKNIINNAWNPTLAETFTFSLSGQENVDITTSATEESEVDATGQSEVLILNAGEYTLSENLLSNWSLTGMSCTNEQGNITEEGNGLILSLSNGEEVTCTFTNTRKTGTLTVNKIVINDHAGTNDINDFSGFQVNGGTIIPFNSNEEESAMESHTTITLESGVQYDITEPETSGYDRILENNCRDINVDANMNYICDITNNDNAPNTGGSVGGDPTPFSPSTGSVLGASTENTSTETPKEEMKEEAKGEVLGEEIFKFLKNMKLGSRLVPDVTELQKRLTKEGFYGGPISGYFGLLTKDAVIKYQTKYSPLTTDGVVGPRTRGVLNGTSAPLPNSASI